MPEYNYVCPDCTDKLEEGVERVWIVKHTITECNDAIYCPKCNCVLKREISWVAGYVH